MIRVFNKWFWSWNLEKGEKWLRKKSEEGFQLYKVSLGRYYFKEEKSKKYKYEIQLLSIFNINNENEKYIEFLDEMGVELVDRLWMWGYFRKLDNEDSFEIFSDIDSKMKNLVKLRFLCLFALNLNVLSVIINNISSNDGNKFMGLISSIFIIILATGIGILSKKLRKLKRERIIRE